MYIYIYFFYVWLEFHRHAQFHITTPQRVIRILHYSPTLWHITAQAVLLNFIQKKPTFFKQSQYIKRYQDQLKKN